MKLLKISVPSKMLGYITVLKQSQITSYCTVNPTDLPFFQRLQQNPAVQRLYTDKHLPAEPVGALHHRAAIVFTHEGKDLKKKNAFKVKGAWWKFSEG